VASHGHEVGAIHEIRVADVDVRLAGEVLDHTCTLDQTCCGLHASYQAEQLQHIILISHCRRHTTQSINLYS